VAEERLATPHLSGHEGNERGLRITCSLRETSELCVPCHLWEREVRGRTESTSGYAGWSAHTRGDSRFANLLFHRWLRGKNLESLLNASCCGGLRLVEHLRLDHLHAVFGAFSDGEGYLFRFVLGFGVCVWVLW